MGGSKMIDHYITRVTLSPSSLLRLKDFGKNFERFSENYLLKSFSNEQVRRKRAILLKKIPVSMFFPGIFQIFSEEQNICQQLLLYVVVVNFSSFKVLGWNGRWWDNCLLQYLAGAYTFLWLLLYLKKKHQHYKLL